MGFSKSPKLQAPIKALNTALASSKKHAAEIGVDPEMAAQIASHAAIVAIRTYIELVEA